MTRNLYSRDKLLSAGKGGLPTGDRTVAKPKKPRKPKPQPTWGGFTDRGTDTSRKAVQNPRGPFGPPMPKLPPPKGKAGRGPLTAADEAAAIYGPYLAELRKLRTEEMGRQSAEAQRIRDAYAAYAQYLQGLPGQIQGLYQSAGSDQAALAKGFSDGMQHTAGATAAEVNAELARMGAPEGQQIPASQATGAGDVLYGVGGYIPGNALTTSGAAFASAAAFMGPNALKAGMLESQKYLTDSKKALTEYDLKIAEIVGDQSKTAYEIRTARKEARAKYKSDLAKAKADARKVALAERKQSFSERLATAKFELDKWKANNPSAKTFGSAKGGYFTIDPVTGEVTRIVEGLGQDPGRLQKGPNGSVFDPNTGTFTRNGRPYTPPIGGSKKFSASQIGDANDSAVDAWNGIQNEDGTWDVAPMSYGAAYAAMVRHGIPAILAQQALNKFWKRRGFTVTVENRMAGKYNVWEKSQSGRPLKDFVNPKVAAARGGRQNTAYDASVPVPIQDAIGAAMKQLGQKYVWGAESRGEGGFDCSGLIDWAFRQAGVDLPGRLTTWSAAKLGSPVALNALRPGDFIISNSGKHMTLYIGGGKVIAASSARGRVVTMGVSELGPITAARRLNFGGSV